MHIKELASASRVTQFSPVSKWMQGLIVSVELSSMLQCISSTQGAWCFLEVRHFFQHFFLLLSGAVRIYEINANMHYAVFHHQQECEGQQHLPGVPERVEATTPWSNVSWRQERQSMKRNLTIVF